MKTRQAAMTARRAALAVIALVALVSTGCSKKIRTELIPNQRPEVRLTAAPTARDSLKADFYAYTMQWVGYDPDGRVDHFLLAVDPVRADTVMPSDTTWHVTARNESTFFFPSGRDYDPIDPRNPKAQSPHIISIFAVDNDGLLSRRPATRGFFSFTQCPSVQILEPTPESQFQPNVTPTVTFAWTGQDPDGQFTVKPVRWVFRLFGQKNPDRPDIQDYISYSQSYPDSIRRFYAPEFPGWTSVGAETTTTQFRNLNPGSTYLFVVTGFDEAGAYDPVFLRGRTMLIFGVTFAGTNGPTIRMFNQFFDYTYPFGGYDPSEVRWFRLEVPADQPITFYWIAAPPPGANMRRYRWVMDLRDLTDQTGRTNEDTDYNHWSAWSFNRTTATLKPFANNGEEHLFYIEAEDSNGLVSLGIIFFRVVRSTFERNLLFVDDTRFRVDRRISAGNPALAPPTSTAWPTAAELDTFLFARGGFPYKAYPAGTVSQPGIFNGYDFDTIGTRGVSVDGTVPLSFLGQYRHIVWYVDELGASYSGSPYEASPITALRLVNSPGRPVILSTYMTQGYKTNGGFVWLAGGGAAYATLFPWNKTGTPANEYTNLEPNPELRPGRMMYDFAHWRDDVEMNVANNARRFGTTNFGTGDNRPGRHWPTNPPLPTPLSPPDYSTLPAILSPKTDATDPPPPYRTAGSAFWLRQDFMAEYIPVKGGVTTYIREDYDDDPEIEREFSTLDTLYICQGLVAIPNSPVMTYYHGRENQPFVFSGFNFWYWRRTQCIELVDWVLHNVWGLQRDPAAPREPIAPTAARRARR